MQELNNLIAGRLKSDEDIRVHYRNLSFLAQRNYNTSASPFRTHARVISGESAREQSQQ